MSDSLLFAGRYRLESRLAAGGMGEVWQATDTSLGRQVAVKLLHPHLADDPEVVARFRREARAAARLHHPGIVPVYDTCTDRGREAIVLQLIDGPTLRQYLDQAGPLTDAQAATIGASVADALVSAHAAGLVHRDIKPANILFGPDRALLTDFGVAKALDETDHTASGMVLGSVRYLSPEQVEGRVPDGRSDLFSLGVVLYECVSGTTPWRADTPTATAVARLDRPPEPLAHHAPSVSPAFAEVVHGCLARHPEDRFADASALHRALVAILGGNPPALRSPAPAATPVVRPGAAAADATVSSTVWADGNVAAGPVDAGADTIGAAPPGGMAPDGYRSEVDEGPDDADGWDDGFHDGPAGPPRRRSGGIAVVLLVLAALAVIVALVASTGVLGTSGT